jgi:hypothetical protein
MTAQGLNRHSWQPPVWEERPVAFPVAARAQGSWNSRKSAIWNSGNRSPDAAFS